MAECRADRLLSFLLVAIGFASSAEAVTFSPYRVPEVVSVKAARDLEFLWSQTYSNPPFSTPLVPPGGGTNDLDRFGRTLCDEINNPFGFNFPDIELVYDYLNFPWPGRSATYNPTGPNGFLVPQSDYSDPDRNHIDTYLYMPRFSHNPYDLYYEPDLQYPEFGGDQNSNHGDTPSNFVSPDEDLSSGHLSGDVLPLNSLDVPGPTPSQVGDTGATRWTSTNARRNWMWIHEFQHAFNDRHHVDGSYMLTLSELFSRVAEAVAGEISDPPSLDSRICLSLLNGAGYPAWRSFGAYLVNNFRGTDLSEAGRTDDLVWRWSRGNDHKLSGLAARLDGAECAECQGKTYFQGLSGNDRLQVLIHNWHIANYVNAYGLAEHQFGFDPSMGFSPDADLGMFMNNEEACTYDAYSQPYNLSAVPAWRTREFTTKVRPACPGTTVPLDVAMFGAEYFAIHRDAALGQVSEDLVLRLGPLDNLIRTSLCASGANEARLRVSVVTYSNDLPTDSLFRHPEWATSVTSQQVRVDSSGRDLEFVVSGFGGAVKAALVVASLVDGPSGYYSKLGDISGSLPGDIRVSTRFSASLRSAPFQSPDPKVEVATSYSDDDGVTWAPSGTQIAFHSNIPFTSVITQIFKKTVGSGSPSVLFAQPTRNQFRPDWSPRGDWVVFESAASEDQVDLWLYNTQTGVNRQLTSQPGVARSPVFQPNGRGIAYAYLGANSNTWSIRTIDLDGSNDISLGMSSAVMAPTVRWIPDGTSVYMVSDGTVLYAANAGGTSVFTRNPLWFNKTKNLMSFDFHRGGGPLVTEQAGTFNFPLCTYSAPFQRIATMDTVVSDLRTRYYLSSVSFHNPRWSFDGTKIAYCSNAKLGLDRDIYIAQQTYDHPPTFTSNMNDRFLDLCGPFSMTIAASDPDGQTVTYQAVQLPAGATFTSNHFNWTPTLADAGEHDVVFRALDGTGGMAQKVVRFTVDDAECPISPVLAGGDPEDGETPATFALDPSRPNPFWLQTSIGFALPRSTPVRIEIVDLQGRSVRTLVEGERSVGRHQVTWDSRDSGGQHVRPGVYFCHLSAGDIRLTQKLLVSP